MVLFYCETCGVRVAPEDLDDGTARRIDVSRALCSTCVSQERAAKNPSPDISDLPITFTDEVAQPKATEVNAAQITSGETRKSQRLVRTVAAPNTKPASGEFSRKTTLQTPAVRLSSGRSNTSATDSRGPNKWVAFGAGAGVVLVGVLIALLRSPAESGEPAKIEKPTETPVKVIEKPDAVAQPETAPKIELPKDPREREAFLLLDQAKVYQRANSDDVYGYAEKLDQLSLAYRATPSGEEAQRLLKAIQYPDPQSQLAPESAWVNAVNLSDLIDTKKDIVSGKWSKSGKSLIAEVEKSARIQIPYEPPEEYDFRIVFKRVAGEEDVNQMLSARGKMLVWSMAPAKNTAMGFECINGKDAASGSTAVKFSKALENNRTYTSLVQVRKRVVRAFLDGKIVKEYRTDYSEFSMRGDWRLKNERALGLGAYNSKVIFDKIELRPVTGTGKKIR